MKSKKYLAAELERTREYVLKCLDVRARRFEDERQMRMLATLEMRSSLQRTSRARRGGPKCNSTRHLRREVVGRLLDTERFQTACAAGRLVPVRAFLQNGGDVNTVFTRTSDGSRSCGIVEAVRHGHLEVAAKLLACHADADARVDGPEQETALHLACAAPASFPASSAAGAGAVASTAAAPDNPTSLDPRMVQLLSRVGANAGLRTARTGRTPLVALAAACTTDVALKEVDEEGKEEEGGGDNGKDEGDGVAGGEESHGGVRGSDAPGGASERSKRRRRRRWFTARTQARVAEILLDEAQADIGAVDAAGRSAVCYARERQNAPLLAVLLRKADAAPETSSCKRGSSCPFCR